MHSLRLKQLSHRGKGARGLRVLHLLTAYHILPLVMNKSLVPDDTLDRLAELCQEEPCFVEYKP
jgi:hypothetical protein